jgi:hypothetical protein
MTIPKPLYYIDKQAVIFTGGSIAQVRAMVTQAQAFVLEYEIP